MHIAESLCWAAETQHCKATIVKIIFKKNWFFEKMNKIYKSSARII